MEKQSWRSVGQIAIDEIHRKSVNFSRAFDRLSIRTKKVMLICVGLSAASSCLLLITNSIVGNSDASFHVDAITRSKSTYKYDSMQTEQAQKLIPIGKMKGELNGEFEAFYLATDYEGKLYINRDPSYRQDRFMKSNGWELITKEQFKIYEKELHYIPHNSKGLTP